MLYGQCMSPYLLRHPLMLALVTGLAGLDIANRVLLRDTHGLER